MPAAPDPDLALRLAKALVDLYASAGVRLLELVARRLARGISQPGWAETKLLQTAALRDEAQAVLDALAAAGPDAIEAALAEAFAEGAADAAPDLEDVPVLIAGPSMPGVDQLVTETVTKVRSTHPSILRQVDDTYRSVIAEAAAEVPLGTRTRLQAAQAALDRFAQRGITGYVDRAGRRWELESYVETAVRTAAGRAQVAGTLDRLAAAGRDLVIVSEHTQECALCRPWEGRVLSITGTTPGYPTVAAAQSAGLHHPNCRHNLTAYIPGLTAVPAGTEDPDGDRARQEQRRLERGIRAWKRRAAVALDDPARRRAEAQARQWQARLRTHLDEHPDLTRHRERERLGAR